MKLQPHRYSIGITGNIQYFQTDLHPRLATITNSQDATRITYVGFNRWCEACGFVLKYQQSLNALMHARRAKRLVTTPHRRPAFPYEVKIRNLNKDQVIQIYAWLTGETGTPLDPIPAEKPELIVDIRLAPDCVMLDVYINNQYIAKMYVHQKRDFMLECEPRIRHLSFDEAKAKVLEYLGYATVKVDAS